MNKEKFLETLRKKLRHLPKEDLEDAMNYYTEYLDEMQLQDDEDVTKRIGTPSDIAREIIRNSTDKHIELQKEKGSFTNNKNLLTLILLGICTTPITIPLIAVIVTLFVACVSVAFAVVVSIIAVGVSLVIAGIAVLPAIIWAVTIPQKLVCLGISLFCLGISILFIHFAIRLSHICARTIANIFKKIIETRNRKQVI